MPEQSFNTGGYRSLKHYRLVPGLFGHEFQQMVEHRDGSRSWHRQPHAVEVAPRYGFRYRIVNGFWGARMEMLIDRPDGTSRWVREDTELLRTP